MAQGTKAATQPKIADHLQLKENTMRVWVWRDCEPLPFDPNNPRLMRAGMLSAALAERGHEVRWFNSTFDHYQKRFRSQKIGQHALPNGVTVELVKGLGYFSNGSPRRLIHNALVARRFSNRARQIADETGLRPDLIIADLPMPDTALSGVRLAKEWNIPSIVSIRDLWPDFFESFLSPTTAVLARPVIWNLNRIVCAACSEADHLIGISDGYLKWGLVKAGRERRVGDAIAPLGYSSPPVTQDSNTLALLRDKGINTDKKLATFIGSWGRTYDLHLLLDAARILNGREDVQFVIAGQGEQGTAVEAIASKLPNVVLPGWLDKNEIATLLAHSDVALAPYTANAPQGLPNKLFEYMAQGLFQITTLGDEARLLLEDSGAGIVVPGGDSKAYAAAINSAFDVGHNPATKAMIKTFFEEHFDAEKVYGLYADKLEEILAKHPTHSDD